MVPNRSIGRIVSFCGVLLFLLYLLFLLLPDQEAETLDVYIFSDIEECRKFDEDMTSNAKVTIYNKPDTDTNLKDLKYLDFYACKCHSGEFEFEMFAYNFIDSDTAKEYFKNETGKNDDLEINFSNSSGMGLFRSIVIDGNKAYSVYCKDSDSLKVIEFINSIFTKQLVNQGHTG